MKPPDISVVIVSWNVRDLLLRCVESVRRHAGALDIEIIVVDNASADGSLAAACGMYPDLIGIQNSRNVGFAAATNAGLRRARGEMLLLLNPDTEVCDGALQAMVAHLRAARGIGILGPRLIGQDGVTQVVCARDFPSPAALFYYGVGLSRLFPRSRRFNRLFLGYWDHADSRSVPALCGACMLISRDCYQALGGLDESHPMYLEDIDYCKRSINAGFANFYLASARVVHHEARSSLQVRPVAAVLSVHALWLFFVRYGSAWTATRFRLLVLIQQAFRLPCLLAVHLVQRICRKQTRHNVVRREWQVLLWAIRRRSPVLE